MEFIGIFVMYILFTIIDYFIIKFEIKRNINLFYAIHKKTIEKELFKMEVFNNEDSK